MTDTSTVYHQVDRELSTRQKADRVLVACFDGKIKEAAQLVRRGDDADSLLAQGVVAYWLARKGTQYTYEEAKDILSKAARLFTEQGEVDRALLADIWLGMSYWAQGQYPEAFILLNKSAESSDPKVRFMALVNISVLQTEHSRWRFALATLATAQPLFDLQDNYSWRGKFFQQRGLSYKQAYGETRDPEDLRRALTDYESAGDLYETAGNLMFEAAILNNMANLYLAASQLQKARNNADRAITIYERIGDRAHLAHAKDTKALVLLECGEHVRAKRYADQSIALLRKHDPAWVITPLVTRAKIHFAMGMRAASIRDFEEAIEVARVDCPSRLADIYLDQVETLSSVLSVSAVADLFARVLELRPNRELRIAKKVLAIASTPETASLNDLKTVGHKSEREIILRALESANGSVSRAAAMLQKTHGGLSHIIRTRHKDLLSHCRPIVRRRKTPR